MLVQSLYVVQNAGLTESVSAERMFLKDELSKSKSRLLNLKLKFVLLFKEVRQRLSFSDYVRFSRLLGDMDVRERGRLSIKYSKHIDFMVKDRHGKFVPDVSNVMNLSDVQLSRVQLEVLARGLHFGVPKRWSKESVFDEFECFYQSVIEFSKPVSSSASVTCKTKLASVTEEYGRSKPDLKSLSLRRDMINEVKKLYKRDDIIISKPDKGRAAVAMNKCDYTEKMMVVLQDKSKFQEVGPAETLDRTDKTEQQLSSFLFQLLTNCELSEATYKSVRPVGSCRPRMYSVPKIHKSGVPLRPILSMSGSPQYAVSQWLCSVFEPVLLKYGSHCVKDSFTSCQELKDAQLPMDGFMCSFDVVSLFTNAPLDIVIDICAKTLYSEDSDILMSMQESSFRYLLKLVTFGVEFSCNNVMYCQTDSVAMGSPLGPVLANMFLGYCESLVPVDKFPMFYRRYVDDTFAYFSSKPEALVFKELLDKLHPSLKFTCV